MRQEDSTIPARRRRVFPGNERVSAREWLLRGAESVES
jgi:hypothetical protein